MERRESGRIPPTGWETGSEVCPVCEGRGYLVWRDAETGEVVFRECKCETVRRNRERIRRSGLSGLVERCTFDTFQTPEPWQRAAREAAERYLEDWRGKWFFIGGSSGAGKTHLCTAICGKLMEAGVPVRYMQWRADVPPIKAVVNDPERYRQAMDPLKRVRVLYIDDFLKGSLTGGDLNIAFELLNHRYIDREKVTILSSELTLDRIMRWDAGVGGRIHERAEGFTFNLCGKRNWRLTCPERP